jgi:hypothetical protein
MFSLVLLSITNGIREGIGMNETEPCRSGIALCSVIVRLVHCLIVLPSAFTLVHV